MLTLIDDVYAAAIFRHCYVIFRHFLADAAILRDDDDALIIMPYAIIIFASRFTPCAAD